MTPDSDPDKTPPCEDAGCMLWLLIGALVLGCSVAVWLVKFFW